MKESKVSFNLKGMQDLTKGLAGTYRTRVGVLGAKAARNSGVMNNADIGVIQMFGSITNNIPPRDFLLMPIQRNQKQIMRGMQSTAVKKAVETGDYKAVFKLLGIIAETWVHKAFETSGFGQWAPNKPSTIDRKGSSKPLIDTRQLDRSVSSEVVRIGGGGKKIKVNP